MRCVMPTPLHTDMPFVSTSVVTSHDFYPSDEICPRSFDSGETIQTKTENPTAYALFFDAKKCRVFFTSDTTMYTHFVPVNHHGRVLYGKYAGRYFHDDAERAQWLAAVLKYRVMRPDSPWAHLSTEGKEWLEAHGVEVPDSIPTKPGIELIHEVNASNHDWSEQILDCPYEALVGTTNGSGQRARQKYLQVALARGLPWCGDFFNVEPPCKKMQDVEARVVGGSLNENSSTSAVLS
ncbi:unnamed protein product [Amoebophrya sp. A25]|nr:unnamed protein product [Amoebophrya sp. A25]|eukprot:GSA25T00024876001.1